MPSSGLGATPEGDAFDFALREALPGAGLPLRISGPQPALVERLAQLNAWRRERIAAQDWADCLTLLPAQLGVASSTDVLEAWTTVLDGAAAALGSSSPIALEMFWPQVQLGLALEELRVPDRRRDVVHVMDAYEARQWELPVVFVCGMVERHFPQYHREDPLLGDAARRRAGMPTSEDRQSEEKLLFELAMSRATEEVAVSYSRFNDKGEELLRSFFLGDAEAQKCETRVRPRATRPVTATPHAAIHDAALLTKIAGMHKTLSATSLESFVQCPFQFFGSKTLRLRERPAAPRDRLDVLVQGSILHRTLAELAGAPLLGAELLNAVFSEECRRARVPSTYRTEAVRLEMLRNLEAYLKDGTVKLGWDIRVEEKFQFTLSPQLDIRGRIDRLEISPRNAAVVIDYKYSAGNKIRERVDESAGGHLVQAGVYLLAAERSFGLEPAGMFFCGLKNPVTWDGWHTGIAGLERVGESTSPQVLRELMDNAAEAALKAAQEIGAGRIEPKPRDSDKCRWCEYRDICRIEEAPVARGAAGAAQD
jgi:ATP-dependent helicase/DNAse subunit B